MKEKGTRKTSVALVGFQEAKIGGRTVQRKGSTYKTLGVGNYRMYVLIVS